MQEKTRAKNFLKLKNAEDATFSALSEIPQSVAQIAKSAELPRMTVFEALQSLKRRGVAEKIFVGKRHFWSKINPSQIADLLQLVFDSILQSQSGSKKKLFIRIIENIDEIAASLEKVFKENSGGQIIGVQSTASARASIKAIGVKKIAELNKLIKKCDIVVEGVLEGNFTEIKKEFGENWAESYVGRAAAITFVPENFLDLTEDIYIFSKSLFIINWNEKIALEIIHPEIISSFQKIIRALALLGRKVDINKLIRNDS